MAKRIDRNIIVGLDIGTSKVAAIVAEHTGDGEIEIIGIGMAPSKGLKKGWLSTWKLRCFLFSELWKKQS